MSQRIAGYDVHPAATIFPMLPESELTELAQDIGKRGLLHPIVYVSKGQDQQILDGRNRLLACTMAGVEPRWQCYEGDDPVGHVVALNLHRRHLTKSQLGLAAQRARAFYEERAKERQRFHAGTAPNTPGLKTTSVSKTSRDEVGEVFGVSGPTVDRARKVLETCPPEVVAAVERGEETVVGALKKQKEKAQKNEEKTMPKPERKTAPKPPEERDELPGENDLESALWYTRKARAACKRAMESHPGMASEYARLDGATLGLRRRLEALREQRETG